MIQKYCLLFVVIFAFIFSTNTKAQDSYDPVYSPDALSRLYLVGLQYFNSTDFTQAEVAFSSIVAFPFQENSWREIRQYKGKAYGYLGDIYFIQKRYARSISNYLCVIQNYSDVEQYSSTLFKLGRSYILNNQPAQGIEVLKDYSINYGGLDRTADNTLYWIAKGYLEQKNYIAALNTLQQILTDYPNTSMAVDIRSMIASLQTTPTSSEQLNNLQNQIESTQSDQRMLVEAIAEEKNLIDRMKYLLTLKEQLLQLKNNKLSLLEKAGVTRQKLLDERQQNNK